jgi:hypothetical protein
MSDIQALPRGQTTGKALDLYAGRIMPQNFGQVIEFAQMMAKSDLAIPKHLRGNPGACMAIIQRCLAWEIDPWAAATKTYLVNDQLAYEAQLIVAVVNRKAPIQGRLVPVFQGEGQDRVCVLEPKSGEGQVLPYKSPKVKDISPKNSPLWKNDPDQQLFYTSARAWCRRYFPEILLGVYDREEVMAMKDITPAGPVENYLEDEPEMHVEVRVAGEGGELVHKGTAETAAEFVQEKKKIVETNYTAEEITPEEVIDKITKAINAHTDAVLLEQWQHDNHASLNSLPPDILKRVRKALADKLFELEG